MQQPRTQKQRKRSTYPWKVSGRQGSPMRYPHLYFQPLQLSSPGLALPAPQVLNHFFRPGHSISTTHGLHQMSLSLDLFNTLLPPIISLGSICLLSLVGPQHHFLQHVINFQISVFVPSSLQLACLEGFSVYSSGQSHYAPQHFLFLL